MQHEAGGSSSKIVRNFLLTTSILRLGGFSGRRWWDVPEYQSPDREEGLTTASLWRVRAMSFQQSVSLCHTGGHPVMLREAPRLAQPMPTSP